MRGPQHLRRRGMSTNILQSGFSPKVWPATSETPAGSQHRDPNVAVERHHEHHGDRISHVCGCRLPHFNIKLMSPCVVLVPKARCRQVFASMLMMLTHSQGWLRKNALANPPQPTATQPNCAETQRDTSTIFGTPPLFEGRCTEVTNGQIAACIAR